LLRHRGWRATKRKLQSALLALGLTHGAGVGTR
jgi:hypothetical protein